MIRKVLQERLIAPVVGAISALLMLLGLGVATAAPAAAAWDDCPTTHACFFAGLNGNSTLGWVHFANQIPNFGGIYEFNDQASSLTNRGQSCTVFFYSGTYGGGYEGWNSRGTYWASLHDAKMGSSGLSWNDQISSGYFCNSQQ